MPLNRNRPPVLDSGIPAVQDAKQNPTRPNSQGPLRSPKGRKRLAKRDPSRTGLLRRQFTAELLRRFERVRSAVWQLVAKQDVFGLVQPTPPTILFDPSQPRDEQGRWTDEGGGITEEEQKEIDKIERHQQALRTELNETVGIDPRYKIQDQIHSLEVSKRQILGKADDRGKTSPVPNTKEQGVWEGSLGAEERLAIRQYLHEPFDSSRPKLIQEVDAGRPTFSEEIKRIAGDLRKAIDKAPKTEATVYRGMGVSSLVGFEVGKEVNQSTFSSWSRDRSIAMGYAASNPGDSKVIFRVRTRVVDVSRLGYEVQKEVLVDKGKRFRVVATRKDPRYSHYLHVDLEEVRPTHNLTANAPGPKAYQFKTKDEKLKSFNRWFADQVNQGILEVDRLTKPWLAKFVESAYKRGAIRAYTDAHQAELGKSQDYYLGSKEQFLRSAFDTPERVSKMRLLGTRAFEELKGITNEMSRQISRVLADGMAHGKGPYDIARTMSNTITGIERRRAKVIARTEIIHAHAEGQLDGFEDLGVEEVGIEAEWSTAGDDIVCVQCEEMEGEVMSIKKARGLIPLHPNCRCAWIPHLKKRKANGNT